MLWFLIALATLLALLSLRGELSRERFYRASLAAPPLQRWPPATVIVPVKGQDQGLRHNLESLASLDYPDYELIVVAHSLEDLPDSVVPSRARVVIAGPGDPSSGEKINNLLAAVAAARPQSTVLAFADSDGRVSAGWLRALVTPLDTPGVGASTGFRWYLPERGGVWPLLRSVWNAVIAGGMGPGNCRFCWGGATAIQRETFFAAHIPAWWRGAISDDYRLSAAIHAAGLTVAFVPGALVASTDSTTAPEFLSWSRRQMMITRFYAPRLWALALFAHVVYCGAMLAGARLAGTAAGLVALQLAIGYYKAWRRLSLARLAMPRQEAWFARYAVWHLLLTPIGTWLWLYSCAAAAFGSTITWRGYRLRLRRLAPPSSSAPPHL